jgi:hypothetical protein
MAEPASSDYPSPPARQNRRGTKRAATARPTRGLTGQARVARLAAEQGVKPIADPSVLLGNLGPGDDCADDFLDTLRAWREERPAPRQP